MACRIPCSSASAFRWGLFPVHRWVALRRSTTTSLRKSWDWRGQDLTKLDGYRADLRGANLSQANLSGASFRMANLSRANLSGITFRGGTFDEESDLSFVNLSQANLCKSWVGGNLSGANLRGADLRSCDLRGARNLNQADLHRAGYNQQETVDLLPTQWPVGFDPDAAGVICMDR